MESSPKAIILVLLIATAVHGLAQTQVDEHSFGPNGLGTISDVFGFPISNLSESAQAVSVTIQSDTFRMTKTPPSELPPHSSENLQFVFQPKAPGRAKATVLITLGKEITTLLLTGTGVGPYLSIPRRPLRFVHGRATLTIRNTGNAVLPSVNATDRTRDIIIDGDCHELMPGAECKLQLQLLPGSQAHSRLILTGAELSTTVETVGSSANAIRSMTNAGPPAPRTQSPQAASSIAAIPSRSSEAVLTSTPADRQAATSAPGAPNTALAQPLVVQQGQGEFAPTPVGSSSSPVPFRLLNQTSEVAAFEEIGTSGSFTQTNDCEPGLQPGATCEIEVSFSPTTVGPATGLLNITLQDGTVQPISLSGSGTAPFPELSVPQVLTFPSVQPDTKAVEDLTITNPTDVDLIVSRITIVGDYSVSGSCSAPVPPGESCSLPVTFVPTGPGPRPGLLFISANGHTLATVSLLGMANKPEAVVAPTALSLPPTLVGQSTPATPITITNSGSAPLPIKHVIAAGDFQLSSSCAAVLPPGLSCTIAVHGVPAAAGERDGVVLVDLGDGKLMAVSLSMTGISASPFGPHLSTLLPGLAIGGLSLGLPHITFHRSASKTFGDFNVSNYEAEVPSSESPTLPGRKTLQVTSLVNSALKIHLSTLGPFDSAGCVGDLPPHGSCEIVITSLGKGDAGTVLLSDNNGYVRAVSLIRETLPRQTVTSNSGSPEPMKVAASLVCSHDNSAWCRASPEHYSFGFTSEIPRGGIVY